MATILIVDDDKEVVELYALHLSNLNHHILMSSSFAEAKCVLHDYSERIDLVITDYNLGDGNGADVALLARQRTPCPKIILMTAYDALWDSDIGDVPVLKKPF